MAYFQLQVDLVSQNVSVCVCVCVCQRGRFCTSLHIVTDIKLMVEMPLNSYKRDTSGSLPVDFRSSGQLPVHFRSISGQLPVHFRFTSGLLPVHFRSTFGLPINFRPTFFDRHRTGCF